MKAFSQALLFLPAITLSALPVSAHHGVASLGLAGLMGPGAPVESSTSATLPQGKSLGYLKVDHVNFETYSAERDDEMRSSTFYMIGGGYGIASFFSLYAFLPYNVKKTEDNSYNTAGTADLTVMMVIGFHYDGGVQLVQPSESLDDMEDWHFTIYGGGTIPSGNPNVRNSTGEIDPGMSTGFGSPSYTIGLTATKMVDRLTMVQDVSYISFDPYRYASNVTARFGTEFRYNVAFTYRGYVNEKTKTRIDPVMEFNYLQVAPDREWGISKKDTLSTIAALGNQPLPEEFTPITDSIAPHRVAEVLAANSAALSVPSMDLYGLSASWSGMAQSPSGGKILYLLPGFRFFRDNISIAVGVKTVVWTRMNRISLPQNLAFAYLQGLQTDEVEARSAFLDQIWGDVIQKNRVYQGSEGRERYRLQISLSFLI